MDDFDFFGDLGMDYGSSASVDTGNWWDDFDFSGGAGDSFSTAGPVDDSWWDFGGSDTGMSRSFGGESPTGPGYYDEITGQFIQDENGGLQRPLTNETSGDPNSMNDWTADPRTGTWSNSATGETFKSQPWNPLASGKSGLDIMKSAGAEPVNWLSKLGGIVGNAFGAAPQQQQQLPTGGGSVGPNASGELTMAKSPEFSSNDVVATPIQSIASLLGPRYTRE
jgi:hypothetical protein